MARNDGVDRTTVRNQPRTESNIADAEVHNERQKACYRNEDIVPERSHLNIHFKEPSGSYQEMFRQMEQDGTISTRGSQAGRRPLWRAGFRCQLRVFPQSRRLRVCAGVLRRGIPGRRRYCRRRTVHSLRRHAR